MKLILIRGLPGSGKSTIAKMYRRMGFHHYEADMYFQGLFGYNFDPTKLREAHEWCQKQTQNSLLRGYSVVVANTFTQLWELQPYLDMASDLGAEVEIIVATGNYRNIHGVPDEIIERMRERWED